jgi:rhodanese-related sulfurtransferase
MSGTFHGDISARQSWQALVETPGAVMIDVRTRAEWSYVGVPDLGLLERRLVQVEWQGFPSGALNPGFADEVAAAGIAVGTPIFLICRSGVRSRAAAKQLAGLGHATWNISDGFEGPLDPSGHRGTIGGWKAAGLPWKQS